jgi:integrase/recombinase XerD
MIPEQIITCPEARAKLSCGPLVNLIDGFYLWLQARGLCDKTIRLFLQFISLFNTYLARFYPLPLDAVTKEDVDDFLSDDSLPCNCPGAKLYLRGRIHCAMGYFIDYLTQEEVYTPELKQPPVYQPLLEEFLIWLRNYHHLAPGSVSCRRVDIIKFFQWLGPQATKAGLGELTHSHVETFFVTRVRDMGQSMRHSLCSTLRAFFRFCLQKGYTRLRLDKAVLSFPQYSLATVPATLSDEQVQILFQSVGQYSKAVLRDHAILLLLYTYGVRAGQVSALRLEDINWTKAEIRFRAQKNGHDILLPLTDEVGDKLFHYIKEMRPASACPEVFLTSRAPCHSLCHSGGITGMVRYYVIKNGFNLPNKGAHLFRYTFASRMVQQNNSLKCVADMLGHRHLSTTFKYTKIDFDALKQVALPWPQEA